MNAENSLILMSDSYKNDHGRQYPPKTTKIYSYFESRGGESAFTLFFGLQYYIKKYLCGKVITKESIDVAEECINDHFAHHKAFDRERWEYILEKYNGYLPVEICAIPEGSILPTKNALFTIENTDPRCHWLTNYLETLLSNVWYPITVATLSKEFYVLLSHWVEKTGADPFWTDWMLHDFGARGVSCPEQAGIGGLAHLSHGFRGTDTMRALAFAKDYYHCKCAGFSVPAYEHSTVTSWGREREVDCYRNALKTYPTGTLSVVSDSWDVFNACENIWGGELREEVLGRDGRLVIRLDSGNPARVADRVGVVRKCLDILGTRFSADVNSCGYRVLHSKVRVLQGDGIDREMVQRILEEITYDDPSYGKWSADNVLFGSGGTLLQKMNRDTLKFALKCAEAEIDGKKVPVYKDPITQGDKKSKRGRQRVIRDANMTWNTVPEGDETFHGFANQLVPLYRNGKLLVDYSLEGVRRRSSGKIGVFS